MIEVKNLTKSYDGLKVLEDLNLKIEKGDVIAVLGPSGSGKTTLLRCLNFLEKADAGLLYFDDLEIDMHNTNKKITHQIRKNTGFVFQNFNLFLNKTALENVVIGLKAARGISDEEAVKNGKDVLDKVGLSDKYDSYPSQLSGGQQQRVAIARALAYKPEIIYFDEPTSALDPELIGEVLKVIKDIANEGMTMLVVTHEMNFARNISNKIVFMDQGKIIAFEETKQFFEKQKNERIKNFIASIMHKGD